MYLKQRRRGLSPKPPQEDAARAVYGVETADYIPMVIEASGRLFELTSRG